MGPGARIRRRQRARPARAMGGGASSARSGPLRSPRKRGLELPAPPAPPEKPEGTRGL